MVTIYKKTIAVSVQTFSISACLKIVRNLKVHVSKSATFHIQDRCKPLKLTKSQK